MAQRFLTLEAAIDLLFSLPDDESRNAGMKTLIRLLHVRVLNHDERNQRGGNSLLEKDAKLQRTLGKQILQSTPIHLYGATMPRLTKHFLARVLCYC
ncbi:hypothetical protein MRX96_022243 [Rhipicephalus microplus]